MNNLARTILDTLDRGGPALTYAFLVPGQAGTRVLAPELAKLARAAAAGYRAAGIAPRTVVPLLIGSSPELWAAFVGAMAADLIPCIFSTPTFKTHLPTYLRNLTTLLTRYESRTLVADAQTREKLAPVLAELAPGVELAEVDQLLAATGPAPEPATGGGDVAFLQHSSGSTGTPKGVALAHDAVLGHLDAYAAAIALDPARDRIASWLPLYHDMGLVTSFLLPLVKGVTCATLPPGAWIMDPTTILAVMTAERSTLAWWPNFTHALLASRVRDEQLADYDLSSLRMVVNCSEPVLARSHAEFQKRFADCGVGVGVLQASYAMAENVFAVTQSSGRGPMVFHAKPGSLQPGSRLEPSHEGDVLARSLMSSGKPIDGVRIRIVDEKHQGQPEGQVGEIAIAGSSLFREYLALPDVTAAARDGDWYFTSDVGFVYHGELFVLGRKTDLIIVGGRKFYPNEIERVAASVDGVKEGRVVAFGLDSAERGTQEVVVLVESAHHEDRARVQAIKKEIKGRVQREIDVTVDHTRVLAPQTLIKTSSGKIARKDNRAWFAERLSEN